MSIQSLYTAATGMDAMQTKLDVIANNLANINTTGFKKDRANFEDLLYRNLVMPGMLDANQTPTPTGTQTGMGTRVQSTNTDFRQGSFQETGRMLDLAIEGPGFLQVTDPQTQGVLFTRAGNLDINKIGRVYPPTLVIDPEYVVDTSQHQGYHVIKTFPYLSRLGGMTMRECFVMQRD